MPARTEEARNSGAAAGSDAAGLIAKSLSVTESASRSDVFDGSLTFSGLENNGREAHSRPCVAIREKS